MRTFLTHITAHFANKGTLFLWLIGLLLAGAAFPYAFAVAAFFWVFWPHSPPSDAEMIAHLNENRPKFESLAALSFAAVRLSDQTPTDISYTQRANLTKELKIKEISKPALHEVELLFDSSGLLDGWSKSFVYRAYPAALQITDLSDDPKPKVRALQCQDPLEQRYAHLCGQGIIAVNDLDRFWEHAETIRVDQWAAIRVIEPNWLLKLEYSE